MQRRGLCRKTHTDETSPVARDARVPTPSYAARPLTGRHARVLAVAVWQRMMRLVHLIRRAYPRHAARREE